MTSEAQTRPAPQQAGPRTGLPKTGSGWHALEQRLEAAKADDVAWRKGRIGGYAYWLGDEFYHVQTAAFLSYFVENAAGRAIFPSVIKLESEVIEMVLGLLQAPAGAGGCFTSSGTESIFLAVKSARDRARAQRRVPEGARPKVVVARTAHPAFDKAAHYLDIDIVRVSLCEDYRVDLSALERELDDRTILTVGSAPSFPLGVFDPIEKLASLARSRDIWMHTDACIGGMITPFLRRLGEPVPDFDFSIPGVTTISVDLHKYGFAPKGASLLLYADAALMKHQTFEMTDWPRGEYRSDVIQGTRAGGAVAAAWAVLNHLGEEGYLATARTILDTKRRLAEGIDRIPGLAVVQPSDLTLLAYRSTDPGLDMRDVAEAMGRCGWYVTTAKEPSAIVLMLNPIHAPIVEDYLGDLKASAEAVRRRAG